MTDDANFAYASLLAGGVLILVGGLMGATMMGTFGGMMGTYGSYGMMGTWAHAMTGTLFAGMAWWLLLIGIATSAIVLYAAYRLRQNDADRTLVGTLGIVGGVLSLLAMGGWIVGAVLAIVGGVLALGAPKTDAPPQNGGSARP